MQFLTALLAFAAVMALMSTIVAVVIEAVVSILGMRSTGLRRLLQGYYRTAVAPRLPEGSGVGASGGEARAFAAAVVSNPANTPGIGVRRFHHLTTRQLIEQFARTNAGRAFLELPDAELRPHLEALAYEFDRYSDGARDFFTRRTKFVSVIVAMILAFSLNIDAIRLYRMLANDQAARDTVLAVMEERDAGPDGANFVSGATEEQFDQLLGTISSMNIPIGFSQYPYCSDYSPLLGRVTPQSSVYDKRCGRVVEDVAKSDAEQARIPLVDGAVAQWVSTNPEAAPRNFLAEARARSHGDTGLWFFSVLVAGGMIGLGGPFWFNVYRRLGLLIPVVGAASALASRTRAQPTQGGEAAPSAGGAGRRDDVNIRGGDALVAAARIAAGQSPDIPDPAAATPETTAATAAPNITGMSPPGTAIGAGSAQRVTALVDDAPDSFRMRRLRG